MMVRMKYRLLTLYVSLAVLLAPVIVLARSTEDEDTVLQEARLEGYAQTVRLKDGSTALTWIMIGFLSAIAIAVLFKNARRTHLD
jgi:voltage-gated potassium channel Kch